MEVKYGNGDLRMEYTRKEDVIEAVLKAIDRKAPVVIFPQLKPNLTENYWIVVYSA